MSVSVFVRCPHCGGTGTLPPSLGGADCSACEVVRVVSVLNLITTQRLLVRELDRARRRLAKLDVSPAPPAYGTAGPKVAGGAAPALHELSDEELRRQSQEYRQWAQEDGAPNGA